MLTYTDIIATALDYADRADDADVVNRMDVFLRVVEARVNRILQTGRQSKRAYVFTTNDNIFYSLPEDFAGMRNILLKDAAQSTSGIVLDYVNPEVFNTYAANNSRSGIYTIVSCSLYVWPYEDNKVLEITYYQQVPPLSETITTNWLSKISPDAYIQGLLVEISSFVKDQESMSLWDSRFRQTLVDMQYEDDIDRWSGPTPSTRVL